MCAVVGQQALDDAQMTSTATSYSTFSIASLIGGDDDDGVAVAETTTDIHHHGNDDDNFTPCATTTVTDRGPAAAAAASANDDDDDDSSNTSGCGRSHERSITCGVVYLFSTAAPTICVFALFLSVCLSVSSNSKSCLRILMQFLKGKMRHKPFNLGANPDHNLDPGIFQRNFKLTTAGKGPLL